MKLLKWCLVLVFHLTQTKGQNFNCSELIPDDLSGISPVTSSQQPYAIQVTSMDDYVLGSEIQVTVMVNVPMSSKFTRVYMAAEDKANKNFIGSWNYSVNEVEYSSFECFDRDTVIAFNSNASTTTMSFRWGLSTNAQIPRRGFFFKATIVEDETTYWSEVTSATKHVEFMCPQDVLFFPTGTEGNVFVLISIPICSRQNISECNATHGRDFPIGKHTIQCNCTDDNGSTVTCDISFEVEPAKITCPEPSEVTLSDLPNITGDWNNTCTDLNDDDVTVTCNVTQGNVLSQGANYIECSCTDAFNFSDSCVFVLDLPNPLPQTPSLIPSNPATESFTQTPSLVPSNPTDPFTQIPSLVPSNSTDPFSQTPSLVTTNPTGNCQLPNLEYSVLKCSENQSISQINCSLDCVNDRVKAIPNYGPISCQSNTWEPPVLDRLCQNREDFISRSIFIYVPVTTSNTNCNEPRKLDEDIHTFFRNVFAMALNEFCNSLMLQGNCNQSTNVEVISNCSEIVTLIVTSTLDRQNISEVAKKYRDMLQEADVSTIPLKNTSYSASLTEQNKQAITISEITFNCSSGYANVKNQYCVLCPPGTYLTALNGACELCDVMRYQDKAGQFSCKRCNSSDLPGAVKCTVPTEEMTETAEGLPLYIIAIIILAGVLIGCVVCLLCITCYFCQCQGGKKDDQAIDFVDMERTEPPRAYDNFVPDEIPEVDVVLRDYAGRTDSDDEDVRLGPQYQYDSPPGTPTELEPTYNSHDTTEI